MSYTVKVILISLGTWLGLTLLIGVISAASGDDVYGIGALLGGMVTGILGIIGLLITGTVILLGKIDGKTTKPPGLDAPLDARPTKLSYRERGLAYFAAAGVILTIGASICFGII